VSYWLSGASFAQKRKVDLDAPSNGDFYGNAVAVLLAEKIIVDYSSSTNYA